MLMEGLAGDFVPRTAVRELRLFDIVHLTKPAQRATRCMGKPAECLGDLGGGCAFGDHSEKLILDERLFGWRLRNGLRLWRLDGLCLAWRLAGFDGRNSL